MTQDIQTEILIVLPLLIELLGLIAVVLIDPYIKKEHRSIMLVIVCLLFGLLIRDIIAHELDLIGTMLTERTLCAIFGYVVRPILLVLYLYIIRPGRRYQKAWILVGVNACIYMTALFSDICFSIDKNNQFHRGPLGYTVHIVSVILLIYVLRLTVSGYGAQRKKENLIPIVIAALIFAAFVFDSFVDYRDYPVTFTTIVAVSSNLFYYIWLHLQFVRAHEDALLAEQRIQIMMTQIQPHFLYNTLSTIQALCRIDPEKAFEVVGRFGTYLRQNIDSLHQPDLIPLKKELEHTKIYAEIEMVRFPNIQLQYDIQDDDFKVPALTIQPLVENAIRHGVRIREKGVVIVRTERANTYHEIVITDNGKGFDVKDIKRADKEHIGIQNVSERMERMCGGRVTVESRIGEGTTVTIRIPA